MSKKPSYRSEEIRDLYLPGDDEGHPCLPLGTVLALVTLGNFNKLKTYLGDLLTRGVEPESIREILLQAHLFAGFPRAIYSLQIFFNKLIENDLRIHQGDFKPENEPDFILRGIELFGKVYGNNADRVRETLKTFHPDYDRWILEDAYGRVLSRSGLPGLSRELCAVSALTVTGAPSQLRSHIMGAFNLGADPEEVQTMICWMSPLVEKKKIDDALEIFADNHLK